MTSEQFANGLAAVLGGEIWLDEERIFFSVPMTRGRYTTFRDTWDEVASALGVLADLQGQTLFNVDSLVHSDN